MRFRLSYTLQRPKTLMKTKAFENGFESGVFWKRSVYSADSSKASDTVASISVFGRFSVHW